MPVCYIARTEFEHYYLKLFGCVFILSGPVGVAPQQRAREAVEWRTYEEEQRRLQEEQSVIEVKQKVHQDEYRKEREELAHLSWRQRKSLLYRANKSKFLARSSEKTQADQPSLPLIVKGTEVLPAATSRGSASL